MEQLDNLMATPPTLREIFFPTATNRDMIDFLTEECKVAEAMIDFLTEGHRVLVRYYIDEDACTEVFEALLEEKQASIAQRFIGHNAMIAAFDAFLLSRHKMKEGRMNV